MDWPRLPPRDFLAGPAESGASCVMVFHSPQASHRPDQRVCVAPQAEQEKEVVFAMRPLVPEVGRFFKPLWPIITAAGVPRRQALKAILCDGR